jgi:hypothetical protein
MTLFDHIHDTGQSYSEIESLAKQGLEQLIKDLYLIRPNYSEDKEGYTFVEMMEVLKVLYKGFNRDSVKRSLTNLTDTPQNHFLVKSDEKRKGEFNVKIHAYKINRK